MGCAGSKGDLQGPGTLKRSNTLTLSVKPHLLDPGNHPHQPESRPESAQTLILATNGTVAEEFRNTNHMLKVLLVGDAHTGKSKLIDAVTGAMFTDGYQPTAGVEFHFKSVPHGNSLVGLQFWDISDRRGEIECPYERELADAVLVAVDVTDASTLQDAVWWKEDVGKHVHAAGPSLPMLLLVMKSDATPDGAFPSDDELHHFCEQNGFAGFSHVSAKTGHGVDQLLTTIARVTHH